MTAGWRWPIPDRPFVATMKKVPKTVLDVISTPFAYAVSERVIDIIERIEPGIHQYLPFDMRTPDGAPHPDKRWLLNICSRVQLLDVERSGLTEMNTGMLVGQPLDKLVVAKAEAERRAVWYEYRYGLNRSHPMVSDRFWEALQAEDCKGWKPIHGWPQVAELD